MIEFNNDKEQDKVKLILKYRPKILGEGGQLLLSTGEKFDLIKVEKEVTYSEQVLGIIKYLVSFFDLEKIPELSIEILDENDRLLSDLTYEGIELKKFFIPESPKYIPKPLKGAMPESNYILATEVRVPSGKRQYWEKHIKELSEKLDWDKEA